MKITVYVVNSLRIIEYVKLLLAEYYRVFHSSQVYALQGWRFEVHELFMASSLLVTRCRQLPVGVEYGSSIWNVVKLR